MVLPHGLLLETRKIGFAYGGPSGCAEEHDLEEDWHEVTCRVKGLRRQELAWLLLPRSREL